MTVVENTMAMSLNKNLLDVTKQNTEKIVIQDWLDGNNFSQTSCGFEPLVVHADVHCSAAGVGLAKSTQSDIDEDFVSVSQILPRKKLNPIKKKCNTNLSNLDAIESYEECKAEENSSDVNNTFDKIFHKGENMAQVIKKTYPGKVKSKMKNTKTTLRGFYTDIFVNKLSQSNTVNNYSVEKDRPESSKIDFSSGSDDVWSPKKYKTREKLLSSQSAMSRKICKKYFKNHSKHINEQKVNCINKTQNKKLLSNNLGKSSKLKKNSYCTKLTKASNNNALDNISKHSSDNKDISVGDINGGSFSKFDNINNNKDVISSVTPLHKNNNYKYKAAGMSVTEYENIIKRNPIVLAKRLDVTAKQEKSNHVLSAISKNKNSKCTTDESFVGHTDVALDNLESSDTKETVEVKKKIINRKLKKIVKLKPEKEDYKNIDISKTVPTDKNIVPNVATNLKKSNKEVLASETSDNVKLKLLNLRKDNSVVKKTLRSHTKVLLENQMVGNMNLECGNNKLSGTKETLNTSQNQSEQLTNTEPNGNMISKCKTNLKTKDPQHEDPKLSRENDVVQQAINSKLNNKGTLKRKIKTTSTTLHQNCGNLIKKLSDDLVKRIPIVLVRPLKIHDSKTQIIKGEGIPKRTKLSVWKGSSNERNNKACSNSLDKQRVTRKDNLNITVCTSKQEKSLLVTPIKVSEQTSPGWSRLERTKKDFNTAQKNRLDVSIGNKLLRSITKLDTSRSSCQDEKTEKSPEIKSRKIVKHLFEKGKQEQLLNIDTSDGGNKFDLQQNGNDFNSPVTNNEALQYEIEEKKRPTSKRKSCDAISDSSVYKQVQSLESNSKRRKSCAENVDSLTPADNITCLRTLEEQKVLKSASTEKVNSSANVGVQTCSDMYLTYCLSVMQDNLQNKGNKKCTSPEAAGSEPLFCDSNALASTLEVSHVATDKAKDSDFILPSCKSVRSLQNRNASSSFIGNNCTDETYFEAVDNVTNLSNYKEIGTNLGSANDAEKERPVVSQDLFSNSCNERHGSSDSCLNNSCKPNIFCDRIPFKELNSVGRLSFDFSLNKCSESILNSKKVPNSGQTDAISFTFRNRTEQCNELSRLDMNKKNLNANEMNEIETVEELYFLCSSSSSASPVNSKYQNISRAIESPLRSTDFIMGTPEALNVARSTQTSDSHFDNESMMSLSTVKLHELSNPSSETDLDYDVVVSSSAAETNSNNNTFLESAVCSGNMLGICTIKEVKRKSVDFEKTLSESIQRMDELTNEVCDSIKDTTWIQQNQTFAATNFTQFTNTVNTSMLTEVLDTQQQKHLGEECIQLEAEIKAMQEELSRKIKH